MDEALRRESDHEPERSGGTYGDNVTHITDRARQQADAAIEKTADELEAASDSVRMMADEHGDAPARAGNRLAHEMHRTAAYLKSHSSSEILHDASAYVQKHPGRTVIGSVIAGFALGRMMR